MPAPGFQKWTCRKCGWTTTSCVKPGPGLCPNGGSHSWTTGDCFITTAVCGTLGAPDDCKELTMIRNFRDTRLKPLMEDGEQLVKDYYRIGPIIVDLIAKDKDSSVYSRLFTEYIKPCCEHIEHQNWEQAKLTYIKMVQELCEKYGVLADPALAKKYFK